MNVRGVLLALSFVFLVPAAAAASFDCNKARTYVEKTVCADPLLSRLDDALARNYAEMPGADLGATTQSLRAEQLRWLASRNRCGNVQCLVDAYRARVDETCDYGVASGVHPPCTPADDVQAEPGSCPITERELLGAWERTSGNGFHEEMGFSSDKTGRHFDSWRHQRPEIAGGSWYLRNCAIQVVVAAQPGLGGKLQVAGFSNGRLSLRSEGVRGASVYRKIR